LSYAPCFTILSGRFQEIDLEIHPNQNHLARGPEGNNE
jgi:hypothetical protein